MHLYCGNVDVVEVNLMKAKRMKNGRRQTRSAGGPSFLSEQLKFMTSKVYPSAAKYSTGETVTNASRNLSSIDAAVVVQGVKEAPTLDPTIEV